MTTVNPINVLSEPESVSMADSWYEYATADHFWVRHRHAVFDRHFSTLVRSAAAIAEVGCGNGLMLRHIGDRYQRPIDGFDLNLLALECCPPIVGHLYVYDILKRDRAFVDKYDILLALDVIEHIQEEVPFLEALYDHVKPGGHLIVNVPMRPHLYSAYDVAAGHYRRYATANLQRVIQAAGFEVSQVVQWGHIYIPLLLLRQFMLKFMGHNEETTIRSGFAVSGLTNRLLSTLAWWDWIPTLGMTGTSCLVLARRPL